MDDSLRFVQPSIPFPPPRRADLWGFDHHKPFSLGEQAHPHHPIETVNHVGD
jgi:hypothetical protein